MIANLLATDVERLQVCEGLDRSQITQFGTIKQLHRALAVATRKRLISRSTDQKIHPRRDQRLTKLVSTARLRILIRKRLSSRRPIKHIRRPHVREVDRLVVNRQFVDRALECLTGSLDA